VLSGLSRAAPQPEHRSAFRHARASGHPGGVGLPRNASMAPRAEGAPPCLRPQCLVAGTHTHVANEREANVDRSGASPTGR